MSVCEDRVIGRTLQRDGTRAIECATAFNGCECCEFGQVYSSAHFTIIASYDQFT